MKTVRAFNETKKTPVAENVRVADGIWSRFLGLMGRRELAEDGGLLLAPCSSVHTVFMRFPIDVVFLDRDDGVVKIVRAMKPYRTALGGGGKKALELPAGTAGRLGLEPGDQLRFTAAQA